MDVQTLGARKEGFRHEALLYASEEEFLAAATPFIRDGVAAGEPVLVAVDRPKGAELRERLGDDAAGVEFVDMEELGRNPARIIPVWRAFTEAHAGSGRRLRGIGEPVWPGRSSSELVECQRHEQLLNLAFDGGADWWLLCPYDLERLDDAVIDEAQRSHPYVTRRSSAEASTRYAGGGPDTAPLDAPLPAPPAGFEELQYTGGPLRPVRQFVAEHARAAGLDELAIDDFVLAVNELFTNSVRHGEGRAALRVWDAADALVCEVRDDGCIVDPLVDRAHPDLEAVSGRGLWMVNQLCDLVQLRSAPDGTVVRLHMRR